MSPATDLLRLELLALEEEFTTETFANVDERLDFIIAEVERFVPVQARESTYEAIVTTAQERKAFINSRGVR
jgi:hypothetical protein